MKLLTLLLLVTGSGVHAQTLQLSTREDQVIQTNTFYCPQKVFLHIDWDPRLPRVYQAEALWRGPDGAVREHTFYRVRADAQRSVLWLAVQSPGWSLAGSSLNGPWTVSVTLEGQWIGSQKFELQC